MSITKEKLGIQHLRWTKSYDVALSITVRLFHELSENSEITKFKFFYDEFLEYETFDEYDLAKILNAYGYSCELKEYYIDNPREKKVNKYKAIILTWENKQ